MAYFKNDPDLNERKKSTYTLTFKLSIAKGDTLYVAHCYPYTYSNLQVCVCLRESVCV